MSISYSPFAILEDLIDNLGSENADSRARGFFGDDVFVSVGSGDAVEERAPMANVFHFLPGPHEGFLVEKANNVLAGAPGATVTRLARIKNHAVVSGLHFRQLDDPTNERCLLVVSNNAKVVFKDCIFERKYDAVAEVDPALPAPPSTTACFVLVESGSRAMFNGCVFRSNLESGAMETPGAGTVVQSLNAAAGSVYVGAGANLTGHSHGTTVTQYSPEI